jgi:hypothetical protein
VNDSISSWIGMVGAVALWRRPPRAADTASTRHWRGVSVCLRPMRTFDKSYASDVAGGASDHAYSDPDLFVAENALRQFSGRH